MHTRFLSKKDDNLTFSAASAPTLPAPFWKRRKNIPTCGFVCQPFFPQQFLYFFPLPHGQGCGLGENHAGMECLCVGFFPLTALLDKESSQFMFLHGFINRLFEGIIIANDLLPNNSDE